MYSIPSLKTLTSAFGAETGCALRIALETYRERNPWKNPSLLAANGILDGYGIEGFTIGGKSVRYVNLGETYQTTLCVVNGKLRVSSWGDIVETLER